MSSEFAIFSVADYLDDDETIAEYLTAAAEAGDPAVMRAALSEVEKVREGKALGARPARPAAS